MGPGRVTMIRDTAAMDIKKKLEALRCPSLAELPCFTFPAKGYPEKLQAAQQSYCQHESIVFHAVAAKSNLLAYLYLHSNDAHKASDMNSQVLADESSNLIALEMSVNINLQQKKYECAEKGLEALKQAANADENYFLLAKAEQAYCLSSFGPAFYHKATEFYEDALLSKPIHSSSSQVVSQRPSSLSDMYPKQYLVYGYELALTYSRLLNQDNYKFFQEVEDVDHFNPDRLFERIKHLLMSVVCSYERSCCSGKQLPPAEDNAWVHVFDGSSDLQWLKNLAARAWVDLGIAFSKYTLKGKHSERLLSLPRHMEPGDCIQRARVIDLEDAHVLETAGRFHAQQACNERDFLFAITLLEKCVNVSPGRHVAYHHLGMAYRNAWIHSCNFPEVKVHTNPGRRRFDATSKNSRKKKNKKKRTFFGLPENLSQNNMSDGSPQTPCEDSRGTSPLSYPPASPDRVPLRRSASEQTNLTGSVSLTRRSSEPVFQNTCITLRPKKQYGVDEFPKPSKCSDYFPQLKANNPKEVADLGKVTHLENAEKYLLRANELVCHTSVKYLTDLARIYISRDRTDEALTLFEKAETVETCNYTDRCYLYEQWAFLRHEMAVREKKFEERIVDIKTLYLEAVCFAVAGRRRSLAYHKLHEIVKEQLRSGSVNESLKKELAVLHHMVELYDPARRELREFHEQKPDDIEVVWKLVELLQATGDAPSAFQYLNIIQSLSKRDELRKSLPDKWQDLSCRICFEALRSGNQYKKAIHLAFDMLHPRQTDSPEYHVMILALDRSRLVEFVYNALKKQYHLKIFLACIEGNCDLEFYCNYPNTVEKVARDQARSIVIFKDDILNEESNGLLIQLLEGMVSANDMNNDVTMCCVATAETRGITMPLLLRHAAEVEVDEESLNSDATDGKFSNTIENIIRTLVIG